MPPLLERKLSAAKSSTEQLRQKPKTEMTPERFQADLAKQVEMADWVIGEVEDTFARELMDQKQADEYRNDLVNIVSKLRSLVGMPDLNPKLRADDEEMMEAISSGKAAVEQATKIMKQLNAAFPLNKRAAA